MQKKNDFISAESFLCCPTYKKHIIVTGVPFWKKETIGTFKNFEKSSRAAPKQRHKNLCRSSHNFWSVLIILVRGFLDFTKCFNLRSTWTFGSWSDKNKFFISLCAYANSLLRIMVDIFLKKVALWEIIFTSVLIAPGIGVIGFIS